MNSCIGLSEVQGHAGYPRNSQTQQVESMFPAFPAARGDHLYVMQSADGFLKVGRSKRLGGCWLDFVVFHSFNSCTMRVPSSPFC